MMLQQLRPHTATNLFARRHLTTLLSLLLSKGLCLVSSSRCLAGRKASDEAGGIERPTSAAVTLCV